MYFGGWYLDPTRCEPTMIHSLYIALIPLPFLSCNPNLRFYRFVRRGFTECTIDYLPKERRKKINLSRNSKYYMKKLVPDTSGISVRTR